MRILPNNNVGVQMILTSINNLKNKNRTFFKNTFNWFLKHPPFPQSYIYYNQQDNSFMFKQFNTDPLVTSWDEFKADYLIREHMFLYSPLCPFEIYITKSDWIFTFQQNTDRFTEYLDEWIRWYNENIEKEREAWKKHLTSNKQINSKKLF